MQSHYITVDGLPVALCNAESVDSRFQEFVKQCPDDLVMKHAIQDAAQYRRVEDCLVNI